MVLHTAVAAAQDRPEVGVELDPGRDTPGAFVRLLGLTGDSRFINALESGFPLYVEYRVELRERRSNWFDRGVTETVIDYVIWYDPLRARYVVEDETGLEEFQDVAALRRRIERVYLVQLEPDRGGTFYFAATVNARMLSDEDVDEAFAWLRGEGDTASVRRPGFLARTARRLLVQVAPLPRLEREGRSAEFRWP